MRKSANLTVDAEILAQAKALGINLSQTFETALAARVREEAARRWREENAGAIEDYNSFVETHGVFGEKHRSF